jgi:hypothetical protein
MHRLFLNTHLPVNALVFSRKAKYLYIDRDERDIVGAGGIRHVPNVVLVHFSTLKRDTPGQMHRIVKFLDIPIDESRWNAIVEHGLSSG